MPLSKQKALYTIFLPLARSLVLSPLFSFSLWGRSGTVPECLTELMAFLSHENWSSRIITVIPLFSSRICSVPTEHVSAPHRQHNLPWHFQPSGPTPLASFHTFRCDPPLQCRKKEDNSLSSFPPACLHYSWALHGAIRQPVWNLAQLTFCEKQKRGRNGVIDTSIFLGTKDKRC